MIRISKIFVVIVILGGLITSLSQTSAYADDPLERKVIRLAAKEQGGPLHRLRLETMEPVLFPLTGVTLYQSKVVEEQTGQIYNVTVDQTGAPKNLARLRRAEQAAYRARYGALTPALHEMLQTMAADEPVTVGIWLKADNLVVADIPDSDHAPSAGEAGDARLPSSPVSRAKKSDASAEKSEAELAAHRVSRRAEATRIRTAQKERRAANDALRRANRLQLARQMTALQRPLAAELAPRGFTPVEVSAAAPLLYVELPKSAILDLADHPAVAAIYEPHENVDAMDMVKLTQKGDVVDNLWGFDGAGVDVGILEDGRIEFGNPYIQAGVTRDPNGPIDGFHATATGGMVGSRHDVYQGSAPGVNLFSVNSVTYDDPDLSAAMDWAGDRNVDIINNSWSTTDKTGELGEHDLHLDYIVRHQGSTVVVAAGNRGNTVGWVSSPALGYNVLSVGNYNDKESLTWDDDVMHQSSSYLNPNTGLEKPEVAASGTGIISTVNEEPWVDDVLLGTSFSAPTVAGLAANLMQREAGLETRAAAVKAIIMATALHNIEGDSRLSDRDGAGGIDMRAAFKVVDEGWWFFKDPDTTPLPYSQSFYAFAGETVRVVITWYSNPKGDYTAHSLELDADLQVFNPDGGLEAASTSVVNNFEIVEFTASKTGYHELRVLETGYTGAPGQRPPIGAAWWPGQRRLTAETGQSLETPPISHHYFRFKPENKRWQGVGLRPPADSDYDLTLYSHSAFGDPADYELLAASKQNRGGIDFIAIDHNHAAAGDLYPEATKASGTGVYAINWSQSAAVLDSFGAYGPYSMAENSVVRVWDLQVEAGQRRNILIRPTAETTADLGGALFASSPTDSASHYQKRSEAVAAQDSQAAGHRELIEYTHPGPSDRLGLVVFNNNSTPANFYIHLLREHAAPANLQATAVSNQVALSWSHDTASDETNFAIERSLTGTTDWSPAAMVGTDVVAYTDTGLTELTTFYYRVRAYRSFDDTYSDYSNIAEAAVGLAAPSRLRAVTRSKGQIDLTWLDNSAIATNLRLERSPTGLAEWAEIAVITGTTTTYSDTEVALDKFYDYRIRAYYQPVDIYSDYSNVARAFGSPRLYLPIISWEPSKK